MKSNCEVISGELCECKREASSKQIIRKYDKIIELDYIQNDTLEQFEANLNEICGNSSSFFSFKKRVYTSLVSIVSGIVIMFALLSSSLYEDVFKKILFESPLAWNINDTVSMLFVLLFFFGLVMMPSILDGEGSQLKAWLQSWFNKDVRVRKRINLAFKNFDKKYTFKIYNCDLENNEHWMWRLIIPSVCNHFVNVEFYVRNDQKKVIEKRLKQLDVLNIKIHPNHKNKNQSCNIEHLLSSKEEILFTLMQLSSTKIITSSSKNFVSLELFEYCGRNFFENKSNHGELISGFQNFINRGFDDFAFLTQEQSNQIHFSSNVQFKDVDDEKRRLSYYLRNHIEECLQYFDNPISLLILYYYVKDIVLDEKRMLAILEKLVFSIQKKQQYDLINEFWFDLAGQMFDSKNIEDFTATSDCIYRKLSIECLNTLMYLFERNGYFNEALKLAYYLYEINPSKYSIDVCSLYERMGEFEKAYLSLDENLINKNENKPLENEIRYYQRKAWIIVSQRKEDKKEEGKECLNQLAALLFSHKQNNEPLWLWHYYNIQANYYEWDKAYESAINSYKKCLSIPALGAFEYGATFLNMSIAYRFIFLEDESKLEIIEESIQKGHIGTSLKQSVGDRDELPVVLHNQALNVLCKLIHQQDEVLIQEVHDLSTLGINILDETGSKKRLGMILVENIIAKHLQGLDTSAEVERLKTIFTELQAYEKEQASQILQKFSLTKVVELPF